MFTMRTSYPLTLLIFTVLVWPVVIGAQVKPQRKAFVINGQSGDATVVQVNGREYIDIEALVRITNGSMGFRNGNTALTLPASAAEGTSSSPDPNHLSRDFMKVGIEEIALLREWASPLAAAIQNGFPVSESWVSGYREKAASGLKLASVAASTAADQSAFALLSSEFELVQQWSNKLVEARKAMNTAKYSISPDALRNEPLSQQIITCAQFLGTMLTSSTFQDDASCH
jgi:hypothetical protein